MDLHGTTHVGAPPRRLPPRGSDGRFRAVGSTLPDPGDLAEPELYINRELSWLEFNRRVLAQAADASVPLLERVRFVSIFHTNLDEFFMVRVAGIRRQIEAGVTRRTPDGLTPGEQLAAISRRLRPMLIAASDVLHEQLLPLLEKRGVRIVGMEGLDGEQRDLLNRYFLEEVFPVLTPLAVDPGRPFPYISNLSVSFAADVVDTKTGQQLFARVKVPGVLPRFLGIPGSAGSDDEHTYLPLERLLADHLDRLFPGMEVRGAHLFRVTRNADLDLEEDEADDLLMAIEAELRRRRFGRVVRLEIDEDMPGETLALLQDELGVSDDDTFGAPGMLRLGDLGQLADLDLPELRYPKWHPVTPPRLCGSDEDPVDIFAEIRRRDLLVHHPYDSFTDSVERFITEAAADDRVLAIKQTLYRTSGDSPIVQALIRAAEKGKQVVALVELKARFDEEANIVWARALEKAGVHVVYGLVGLKTHTKTALVVRREADGLRRYCHIGTGNYNPKTARLYTDLGLLTCDPALGADLTDLFNFLTGYARQDTYRELLVAPVSLRDRIGELIEREIDLQRRHAAGDAEGRAGLIRVKVNALIDPDLIARLYRASQAGVQIDLVVRGICGLRPGVPGISDRVQVVSIVGRLLEHARIMQFGPDEYWIGSADWMGRNLDRRVEAMTPVSDPALRARLRDTLDIMLADNVGGWRLEPDGSWTRRSPGDGEDPRPSQQRFMELARQESPPHA